MSLEFEWDPEKARSNLKKHRVSFEEASTVFGDPPAAIFEDEEHTEEELREILIGHSERGRLHIVSFTERQDRIRIISARQATRQERKDYEEGQER